MRISSILLSLLSGGALAEEAVYETPQAAMADADFAVQGEYVGDRLGVQVVALGRGEFQVITYAGGLPDAGWDGGERQTQDADREEVAEWVAKLKKVERTSPTLGAKPPKSAVVLFDGTPESLNKHWTAGAGATDDGLLMQGCTSVDTFRDFSLHLEFRLPYMPLARGQGRGNSGVYYQGRYETQILDSFGLEGTDHECGGFYNIAAPTLNRCLPPLTWQTYDGDFTAARWNDQGKKTANARLTVRLNGALIHQEVEMPGATLAAPRDESAEPGPIHLQEHGSPVRYRNIWVVSRDGDREARRPIVPGYERFHAAIGADRAAGGRLLLGELNCTACHQAGVDLAARLVPRPAPVLERVGGRVRPEYLLRFIADPSGTKPGTTMPDLFAGVPTGERDMAARAIVNFLVTTGKLREQAGNRQFAAIGEKLFHQVGCVACHAPRNGAWTASTVAGLARVRDPTSVAGLSGVQGLAEEHTPEFLRIQLRDGSVPLTGLADKYTIPALAEFIKDPHQARPEGRMPGLNLNQDEARDLACYLVGDDVSRRLDETASPAVLDTPEDSDVFVFDPSQVEKGRELFTSLACAACHPLKQGDPPLVTIEATRPLADCDPAKGCLAGAPARPAADFALSPVQREALAAALAVSSPVDPQLPIEPPTAAERIEWTMTAFNCFACHARGGVGGPTHERNALFVTTIPEMGDEGRLPPPLDGVGDKLEEGWLRHVLADGSKDRHYMLTRMPRFGDATVTKLADDFIALDRLITLDRRTDGPAPEPAEHFELAEPAHRVKAIGRQLVGDKALACVKCHTFGPHKATGIQALDLLTMTRRIRQDWFQRYLANPSLYRPGTRMPSGFINGRGTITSVYEGDPGRQIAAIWTYLSDGEKAGVPDGLIADMIELKPEHAPIIYRNFIDGLSPRGIAVGYPEQAHLAWDAEGLCLALVWHGRFIDASKHWGGRGDGNQTPLGDDVLKLEQTAPVARLDSLDAAWPAQPPKNRGYRFRGYRLDQRGWPTFRYDGPEFQVEDHPAPIVSGGSAYFERRLTVHAQAASDRLYFLAAVAGEITRLDDGWYLVDGALKIRARSGQAMPVLRGNSGRHELLLPIVFENGKAEIIEELVW